MAKALYLHCILIVGNAHNTYHFLGNIPTSGIILTMAVFGDRLLAGAINFSRPQGGRARTTDCDPYRTWYLCRSETERRHETEYRVCTGL